MLESQQPVSVLSLPIVDFGFASAAGMTAELFKVLIVESVEHCLGDVYRLPTLVRYLTSTFTVDRPNSRSYDADEIEERR